MKYVNKTMVFLVFMLLSYGADAFAYKFTFVNKTGRELKIRLNYAFGKMHDKPILIRSMTTHTFAVGGWSSFLCLTTIEVWNKDSKGKWWGPEKAKKKFLRKDGTEITGGSLADLYTGLISGGWSVVSMCKNKKFILRKNPKNWKISAIIQTNY